ncbi:MAG: paraquat-inducible protein A [Epsilonproteobacteria bacterium]|nr:paraquat-inducible protein A [Campylobacterota bacterium]
MKKITALLLSIALLTIFGYFMHKAYKDAKELERINKSYYEAQSDIEELIKRKFSSLLESLTFGMVEADKKSIDLDRLKAQQIVLKEENQKDIYYLFAIVAAMGALYFLDIKLFTLTIAIASLISLIYGVITPILMIVIHKEVSFLGDVILSYESKTILSTISHLYSNKNYPVALVILLFSIIVPLIKTTIMIVASISSNFNLNQKILEFLKHLGKWSMIDVFVVALLLVYFSVGSSQNSYSQIQNGLYMFLIYVILSLITSIFIDRVRK